MKKGLALLIILCIVVGGLQRAKAGKAKENEDEKYSIDIFAMDTIMSLTAYGGKAEEALASAQIEINRLEKLLSAELLGSQVTRINASETNELDDDTVEIIEEALNIYQQTDSSFDITVYPLMQEWGFISKDFNIPSEMRIKELLALTGSDKILFNKEDKTISFLQEGMSIDLGGIAKGFTSNRVIDIFKNAGVTSAIISLGGNVQTLGTKPDGSLWRVAVQNPVDLNDNIGVISVNDKAVITSGGYQRYFEEDGIVYHHILDPKTGMPANNGLLSVTIVMENGVEADALSTALFVMGKEKAIAYWREYSEEFDTILVDDAQNIFVTEGLRDTFTSNQQYEVISK